MSKLGKLVGIKPTGQPNSVSHKITNILREYQTARGEKHCGKRDCKLELEPQTDSVQSKGATATWKQASLEYKMTCLISSEKQGTRLSGDLARQTKELEVLSFLPPKWCSSSVFLIAPSSGSIYAAATFMRREDSHYGRAWLKEHCCRWKSRQYKTVVEDVGERPLVDDLGVLGCP